ncbi:MAG: BrnT family toxin [Myxococcota bacterium]
MQFEWDEAKREENLEKHGIDFIDALQVFADPRRLEGYDVEHSDDEDRWWTIGACRSRALFVIFTGRDAGNTTRIVSARKAMKH